MHPWKDTQETNNLRYFWREEWVVDKAGEKTVTVYPFIIAKI